jgi:hypothetical protein
MNKLKAIFCVFIALLILTSAVTPALAHSGRTDSNGGHWDHSTGEYHYHHGYSAHQHNNGVCPYDYDNKTEHSSSGSSSNSSNNKSPDVFGFIMTALGLGMLFGIIAVFVCSKIKSEDTLKIVKSAILAAWIITSILIGLRDYL